MAVSVTPAPRVTLLDAVRDLTLRARVAFARTRLDSRLAAGERSASDEALNRRADQLCAPAARIRAARALEGVLAERRSRGGVGSAIPVHRQAVGDARADLERLCVALRAPRPVHAQGVALAFGLLTDGASPLYAPADAGDLKRAGQRALAALTCPAINGDPRWT